MIRVVMVDDQVILRESLKELVEKDPDITVVGCVSNGREAYECCNLEHPDVVLMDIRMPICDGIDGTRLIKQKLPEIKIIILTTFEYDVYITEALKYGAEGYILKDISPDLLTDAIKSVAKGLPVLHQKAMGAVARSIKNEGKKNFDNLEPIPELSDKEKKIIGLIVEGKSNKEIAEMLHLSEGRIRNIITEVFTKCSVKDRTQLAVYAVRKDLV